MGLDCGAHPGPVSSAWFVSQHYLLGSYKLTCIEPNHFFFLGFNLGFSILPQGFGQMAH